MRSWQEAPRELKKRCCRRTGLTTRTGRCTTEVEKNHKCVEQIKAMQTPLCMQLTEGEEQDPQCEARIKIIMEDAVAAR